MINKKISIGYIRIINITKQTFKCIKFICVIWYNIENINNHKKRYFMAEYVTRIPPN